jgi:hypothetical protein
LYLHNSSNCFGTEVPCVNYKQFFEVTFEILIALNTTIVKSLPGISRRVVRSTDVSEEHIASIFSVEELAKQETSMKQTTWFPEDRTL